MKSGTVDCATAAMPESMCFSPHATSQNGSAFAIVADDEPLAPRRAQLAHGPRVRRSCRHERSRAARSPRCVARAHISGAGSSPPSTATLMKRYDAPQTAASTPISAQ